MISFLQRAVIAKVSRAVEVAVAQQAPQSAPIPRASEISFRRESEAGDCLVSPEEVAILPAPWSARRC